MQLCYYLFPKQSPFYLPFDKSNLILESSKNSLCRLSFYSIFTLRLLGCKFKLFLLSSVYFIIQKKVLSAFSYKEHDANTKLFHYIISTELIMLYYQDIIIFPIDIRTYFALYLNKEHIIISLNVSQMVRQNYIQMRIYIEVATSRSLR